MTTNFGFKTLGLVQTVIGKQEYSLRTWQGRITNSAGYDVDTYSDPVTRYASVQPMSRSQFNQLGLDYSKTYIQIFDTDLVGLLSRAEGKNPDQIIFNGYVYEALPDQDWNIPGGWNAVLAVKGDKYDG